MTPFGHCCCSSTDGKNCARGSAGRTSPSYPAMSPWYKLALSRGLTLLSWSIIASMEKKFSFVCTVILRHETYILLYLHPSLRRFLLFLHFFLFSPPKIQIDLIRTVYVPYSKVILAHKHNMRASKLPITNPVLKSLPRPAIFQEFVLSRKRKRVSIWRWLTLCFLEVTSTFWWPTWNEYATEERAKNQWNPARWSLITVFSRATQVLHSPSGLSQSFDWYLMHTQWSLPRSFG